MPFALHDCFEFKGVEYSVPEYSIFPKGSKFIQKYVITPANILDIKKKQNHWLFEIFRQVIRNTNQGYFYAYFFKLSFSKQVLYNLQAPLIP